MHVCIPHDDAMHTYDTLGYHTCASRRRDVRVSVCTPYGSGCPKGGIWGGISRCSVLFTPCLCMGVNSDIEGSDHVASRCHVIRVTLPFLVKSMGSGVSRYP